MRMHLEKDGTVGAIGEMENYAYEAPDFIVQSGHLRWHCLDTQSKNFSDPSNFIEVAISTEQKEEEAKRILEEAYVKIAEVTEKTVDEAQDFVKDDLVDKGKVDPASEVGEITIKP